MQKNKLDIKLLHRDQIDDAQWDARVELNANGLPYALSSYLDLVTDGNWCALVKGDYESIFPLPYEKKLGLNMYLQPPFTQQLGLISDDQSEGLLVEFLGLIPKDFVLLFVKGNEFNVIDSYSEITINKRSNYLLDLNADYETIHSKYSKSLRKRVRKSEEYYTVVMSTDVDLLVDFYQNEMQSRVELNETQYATARSLFKYLLDSQWATIYHAIRDDSIDGVLLVLKYQNRIINLFGTSNSNGKKHFAMHFILNSIIQEHSGSNFVFDFEGSDLAGVKEFYESFGPDRATYPEFYLDRLPFWYKALKKIKSLLP